MAVNLQVEKREILGKKVKHLRKQGFVPAELYGGEVSNAHLSVPIKDFMKAYKEAGESTIVGLSFEDKKIPVLIHDVVFSPLGQEVEHVDFLAVKMDEKIKTEVPLEFVGEAPAVKEKSAILVKAMQEIEVEALPGDLPRSIKVDLTKLEDIGVSIYVKDLEVSDKVKILVDPQTVVASAVEQTVEEEVIVAVPLVEDIKTESEEKKEKKGEEKAGEQSFK
ncbi:MAG: 50S ribosomal protein L25 [Candidatus Wolfebacteria bacterium]|nr:50S ribosomal protein L25 [Candidatus Wolfebacteria bacterium]